ncbi:MAG: VCBS repeat-containing protein, partial [Betaproteobacteria bacterium]
MSVVAFKEKSRVLAELSLLVAAALFFSSTVSAPALAQTVPFSSRLDFAVEAHPTFVAVGDFNGDRVQDLAVTNFDSNTISVLLGNGDGTFRAAPTVAAGANPFAVAVGDFNGDGKLDLVVADDGSNTVSVLLGNG